MKKTFKFFLLILFFQNYVQGQDTLEFKYRISILPTQFVFRDIPITFEKVFKRHTIGLTIEYKPSTQKSGEINSMSIGMLGGYEDQNFVNRIYNAATIGLNSKYYLFKHDKIFIDAELFYRLWWFDNRLCSFDNVEGYRFNGTRTERQNVIGLKLLSGISCKIKLTSKLKTLIDLYGGFGIRYHYEEFETYNGTVGDIYYSYKKDIFNYWWPSLQLGVKIGVEW
jgi:hypothetical protein